MKNKIDWFFLKTSLVFFVIGIIFSTAIVVTAFQFENSKKDEYTKAEANLRATHNQYKNMVNDIDLLEQYTVKYTNYKASGLVGPERRLSWIESLESTNSVLRLPRLTYNLLPQENFDRPGLKKVNKVSVKSSPMQLSMAILHEEDLFALFDGLSLSISSLFTVDSCSIILARGVGQSFDTKSANFNSNCVIRWISIDVKE